ncbi:MAG: DoxX family protein [Bacteroidales bacterium]|nr:DoxX family protein [Bacteroidales bacterium]MBQ5517517.1 DoxX family protein [Bacteroidales bacterium]
MRFLRGLCRVLFALTFILSGILKLLDPVGTGLIVHEYLSFMHLDFLDSGAIVLGIALATLEFLIGICVLSGLRLRIVAWVALILTAFFTILTFYLMRFNPISDCGCFGEAIHLTNTQTFIKNVVLLVLAILIFLGRKRATRVAPAPLEWVFIALFALVGLSVALRALATIPQVDFTAYRVGSSLDELAQENQARFETTFIYTKDGHTEEFTLDNLPDDSWTYLDSKTVQLGGSTRMAQVDFTLDQMEGPVLAVSVHHPDALRAENVERIEAFRTAALAAGIQPVVYGPTETYETADWKSLLTLNRSNGGAVYFNDGTIVAKWANSELPKVDLPAVLQEDPDVLILKHRIREQLYVSILIAGVLVLLVLMRVLCKLLIKKR